MITSGSDYTVKIEEANTNAMLSSFNSTVAYVAKITMRIISRWYPLALQGNGIVS